MPTTLAHLLASGLDLPLIGHASPLTLAAVALAVWYFWPQISATFAQAQTPPAARPGNLAGPPNPAAPAAGRPAAADIAAIRSLVAERDRLTETVDATLADLDQVRADAGGKPTRKKRTAK